MKKLIVLILCLLLSGIHVFGLGCKNCPPPPPDNTPACETERINLVLNGFQINASKFSFHNPIWHSPRMALDDGCEIDVTVKSRGSCAYSRTKTFNASNKEEVMHMSIPIDVPIGNPEGFDVTVIVLSPCIWEHSIPADVHHVWTYTVSYMYLASPCNMLFSGTVSCRNNAGGDYTGNSDPGGTNIGGPGGPGVGGPGVDRYLAKCDEMGIMY